MKKLSIKLLSILLALIMILGLVSVVFAEEGKNSGSESSEFALHQADGSTVKTWYDHFGVNEEGKFTTEFAGGVWMDKTVYKDRIIKNPETGEEISLIDGDNFLVSLAAMASTQSITGQGRVPMDVMFILDMSSSMYRKDGKYDETLAVNQMVTAVNNSIAKLQELNPDNRVGVTLYDGGGDILTQSTAAESGVILMELGRYEAGTEAANPYLKVNLSTRGGVANSLNDVSTAPGLKKVNESTGEASIYNKKTTGQVPEIAATYAQKGILDALAQFESRYKANDTVTKDGTPRQPIFIFMSDGEPTAATEDFTNANANATMGNNQVKARQPNQTDFMTQLTAAYAKAQVDIYYKTYTPLFYTLALGNSISLDVMDPANQNNKTINGYWTSLVNNRSMTLTTKYYTSWGDQTANYNPAGERKGTVITVSLSDGTDFPSGISQQNYVDKYYTAANANTLSGVFEDILRDISLQSIFYPTLVEGDSKFSGEVSFIDNIGEYMEVKDIKGILIGKELYTGALMAQNLNSVYLETNQALAQEFFKAVQTKLSITDDQARTLLQHARYNNQIRYNSADDYSHYIGWFASLNGSNQLVYMTPWDDTMDIKVGEDGLVTSPAAAKGAKYYIKSYIFQANLTNDPTVSGSDAMYVMVWVRTNVATGQESVIFSVPASLIPTVEYDIQLDENGDVESVAIQDVTNPIELVYAVGLRDDITKYNVYEKVSSTYLNEKDSEENLVNITSEGEVLFYTNDFDRDKNTADDTTAATSNTYSYFRPSKENSRYYYTEDTPIYINDGNGEYTLYTGDTAPTGENCYRQYTYYTCDTKKTESTTDDIFTKVTDYRKVSSRTLGFVKEGANSTWYIPKGVVHTNLDGYFIKKVAAATATLEHATVPFVSIPSTASSDSVVNPITFIVGATLGNNGRVGLKPDTGIKVTKTFQGTAPTDVNFNFTLSGGAANASVRIIKVAANGKETEETGSFAGGKYTFTLKANESVYILDLAAGNYILTETETADYKVSAITGGTAGATANVCTVAVTSGKVKTVDVTNAARGKGSLAIIKQVSASQDANALRTQRFPITVKLDGVGTANETFPAVFGNEYNRQPVSGTITTDENGVITKFTSDDGTEYEPLSISHADTININNLPEGTVATVTETLPQANENGKFAVQYTPANQDVTAASATVAANSTTQMSIVNTWTPTPITSSLNFEVSKFFLDYSDKTTHKEWGNYAFSFYLEYYNSATGKWERIGKCEISGSTENHKATFKDNNGNALNFEFTKAGDYDFQIYEEPNGDYTQVMSDDHWFTFSINVKEKENGELYIAEITNTGVDNTTISYEGTTVTGSFKFTNYYDDEFKRPVSLTLEIIKGLVNESNSTAVSRKGFDFELYMDEECTKTLAEFIDEEQEKLPEGQEMSIGIISNNASDASGEAWIELLFRNADTYTLYLKETIPTENGIPNMAYSERILKVEIEVVKEPVTADNTAGGDTADEDATDGNVKNELSVVKNITITDVADVDKKVGYTFEEANIAICYIGTHEDPEFINTYTPTATSVELQAQKTLVDESGNPLEIKAGQFKFTVTDADGKTVGTYTNGAAATANENGEYVAEIGTLNAETGEITPITLPLTTVGTHSFTIQESSNVTGGRITYDKTPHTLTVKVVDNNGVLSVNTQTMSGTAAGSLVAEFQNVRHPDEVAYKISGQKTVNNRTLTAGTFTFNLYEANKNGVIINETPLQTEHNAASGAFAFNDIKFTDVGIHYYVVTERNNGTNGWTYDDTKYLVKLEVTENAADGDKLVVTPTYSKLGVDGTVNGINFINTYDPGSVSLTLNATKYLTNEALEAGKYTFDLYAADENYQITGDHIQSTTNTANGTEGSNIEFAPITYTLEKLGSDYTKTFYYVLKEQLPVGTDPTNGLSKDGQYLYDTSVYNIQVDVTYDPASGLMSLTKTVKEAGKEGNVSAVVFSNHRTVEVNHIIEGLKVLEGRDLKANEFTFILTEVNAQGDAIEGGKQLTATNDENGRFAFGEGNEKIHYAYTDIGDHYFKITEDKSSPVGGINYSEESFTVKVNVRDSGDGVLLAKVETVNGDPLTFTGEEGNQVLVNPIKFTNTYNPGLVVEILGSKTLTGRDLVAEEFEFVLKNAEENGKVNGVDELKATNDADGNFSFTIEYPENVLGDEAYKEFTYKITETKGDVERIVYDETVKTVKVTVAKNDEGKITATVTDPAEMQNGVHVHFVNQFILYEGEFNVRGLKRWRGISNPAYLQFIDKYTFTIEAVTEGAPLPNNTVTTFDAAGNIDFGVITFSESMLEGAESKDFVYRVTESGRAIGVINDGYKVFTVSVTRDGTRLKAVLKNHPEDNLAFTFVNTYGDRREPTPEDDKNPSTGYEAE